MALLFFLYSEIQGVVKLFLYLPSEAFELMALLKYHWKVRFNGQTPRATFRAVSINKKQLELS